MGCAAAGAMLVPRSDVGTRLRAVQADCDTIACVLGNLGELERAAMEVLWDHRSPMLVRDVANALSERNLAYTTVMTVLTRLASKGFVQRQPEGRAWRYSPVASREEYVAQLMLDALSLTGDREAALTHFARQVSTPEAEVLSQALAEKPDQA